MVAWEKTGSLSRVQETDSAEDKSVETGETQLGPSQQPTTNTNDQGVGTQVQKPSCPRHQ